MRLLAWPALLSVAFLFAILFLVAAGSSTSTAQEDDLYHLLGVSSKATAQELKRAYRKRALDTHPDKRKDIPPEEAAKDFHKVVHAFEVLSDEASRRNYDRTGSTTQQQYDNAKDNSERYYNDEYANFWGQWHNRQARPMKDRFEVRQAMSRVMHIVSLSQLQTVMLHEKDGVLERNLLLCFVTPQDVEQILNDDMVFPYPFAHLSNQGIWWEDLLQTCKIRFHRSNDLTRFFGIPSGEDIRAARQPVFLFGRRGQPLSQSFARIQTSDYDEYTTWVWQQMAVHVTFVNHHPYPVEAFWVHGSEPRHYFTLEPGESSAQNSMLSHEWWFRDARVDTYPNAPHRHLYEAETMVAIYRITNDTSPQVIDIQPKQCLDLSGRCIAWKQQGECNRNQQFMKEYCRLTCQYCSEKNDTVNMKETIRAREQQENQYYDEWAYEF